MAKLDLPNFVKNKFDFFAQAVPNLNINGRTTLNSSVGTVGTIFVLTLTFLFALTKLE